MRRLMCILTLLALTLFVCSCKTYVPVETVRSDSIRYVQVERDSIYVLDSVIVQTIADTVYKTKYRYIYKDALRTDTMWRVHTDTLTRVKEVERELTKIESLKMNIGAGVMWAIPIIISLFLLYKKFIR